MWITVERLLWNNKYGKHIYWIFIAVLVAQKEVCFSVAAESHDLICISY
jgi:hypothetical protein